MDLMLGIICSHVGFATTHFIQDQEQGQYIVNSRKNLLRYALSPISLHFGQQLCLDSYILNLNCFERKEKSVFQDRFQWNKDKSRKK